MPLVTETLASYRTRVLRALRDSNSQIFNNQGSATPYADIDAWINEAIRWRDLYSGGSRRYVFNVPLTVGVEFYTLTTAPFFPTDTVLDIVNLWLIFGSSRWRLTESPIDMVTAYARGFTTLSSVPVAWCRYGATQLLIATKPAGAYFIDLDVSVLSVQMVNPGDADPLPFPYTEPVPYKAAALAREQGQRSYEEATRLEGQAREKLADIEGARAGTLPS